MNDLSLFSLDGSVALVTGASSGIGHEVAIGLAQAGAKVIAAARREDRLVSLVEKIDQQGGEALAVALDVTQRDSITNAFDKAEEKFGQPVNVIVNNAGVGMAKSILNVEQEDIDHVMNTNFTGVFYVAQEGARRLVAAQAAGSIINIASDIDPVYFEMLKKALKKNVKFLCYDCKFSNKGIKINKKINFLENE